MAPQAPSGDDDLRDVPCADQAGFLFRHPCGRIARARCATCRKPICERHLHRFANSTEGFCTACAAAQPGAATEFGDSPYFYGSRYYSGYRSYWLFDDDDPDFDDFTPADAVPLVTDGDDAFEQDLGAS